MALASPHVTTLRPLRLPAAVADTVAPVAPRWLTHLFLFTVDGLAVFAALGLYRARVCNLRAVEYAHVARGDQRCQSGADVLCDPIEVAAGRGNAWFDE